MVREFSWLVYMVALFYHIDEAKVKSDVVYSSSFASFNVLPPGIALVVRVVTSERFL